MRSTFICKLFLLGFLSAGSSFAVGTKLCHEEEDTLFACQLQTKKLVSACALHDPDIHKGYVSVIYRFGQSDHIELSLPSSPNQFRHETFTDETLNDTPAEDDIYLRFRNGPFDYLLYDASGSGFHLEGLAVFQKGRLLRKISCNPETFMPNLGYNSLLDMGVQYETDTNNPFRFWSQLLPKTSAVLRQKPFGDPKYVRPHGASR